MLALALVFALAAPGKVIYASGGWAAIDRGARCEALSRSERPVTKGESAAVAGIAFDAYRRHWGEVHVRLAHAPRQGSSVVLDAAGRSFLLAAGGAQAWARDSAQDRAIITALRDGSGMRVTARDASGKRIVERFATRGAATAIDAAAARCAGKMR